MKRKAFKICSLILMVILISTMLGQACVAAETADFVNGSFETLTGGEPGGWTPFQTDWADILKTDGATNGPLGGGSNYIDLSDDTLIVKGVRQTITGLEKGQTQLLSFWYKSTAANAFQIQYAYYDSEYSQTTELTHKDNSLPSTGGVWTYYYLVIPAYEKAITVDDITYNAVADSVAILIRNITGAIGGGADTNMGADNFSIKPHSDFILNGNFDAGSAGWTVTEKMGGSADIISDNGNYCAMLEGAAGNAWIFQSTSTTSSYLPYGYGMTRFRISFKFKTDTTGILPTVKFISVSGTGETDLTVTRRQTIAEGDGWTTYIYYSAPTLATVTGVGLMLRGSAESATVYYDDVTLNQSDFWIYDNNVYEINSLTSGQKINVSAIFANRTGAVSNAEVLVAFYEVTEGAMCLQALYKNTAASIAPNNSTEIRVQNITTPAFDPGTAMMMNVFVWEGLDSIAPHRTSFKMSSNS